MKRKLMPIGVLFLITTLLLLANSKESFAHGKEKHDSKAVKNQITYKTHIKPLFDKHCMRCHGLKSPAHMEFVKDVDGYKKKMKGPRMDSYTYLTSFIVWPDTGSLMRVLDDGKKTEGGKPGKMYKHLGKTDEIRQNNLNLFKDRIGIWTLKNWDGIQKKELNKMKLIY